MTIKEYNKCVDEYADRVFRFLIVQTRNKELAKDILQDCFEKMWLKHENIQFEKARSYLFTAAYHGIIDNYRKNNKNISLDEVSQEQVQYHNSYHHSDLKEILEQALKTLPIVQKNVLLLRDYEGYEYKEIAEITGLSESQVKVYIFRARMKMKEYLGKIENIL